MKRPSALLVFSLCAILFLLYVVTTHYTPKIGISSFCSGSSQTSDLEASATQMRRIYAMQAASRAENMRAINAAPIRLLSFLRVPEVFCPELVRIGHPDDGGKWICGVSRLPQNCIVYSLGLSNSVSFEAELANVTENRCRIYGVDMDEQNNATKATYEDINGVLHKKKLTLATNETANQSNLGDLFRSNDHSRADVLKMDIEGAEYQILKPFLEKIRVCQILIEIHASNSKRMMEHVTMIASFEYLLFSYEINSISYTGCAEFAFIHESCLEQFGAFPLAKWIPRKKE